MLLTRAVFAVQVLESLFHTIDCYQWFQVPFTTLLSLCAMWFGISLPLIMVGYYFGYRKQVRTPCLQRHKPQLVFNFETNYIIMYNHVLLQLC